jgi:hypothetical protein
VKKRVFSGLQHISLLNKDIADGRLVLECIRVWLVYGFYSYRFCTIGVEKSRSQENYKGLLVTARSSVFCFPCRWDVAEMGVRSGCIYLDGWKVCSIHSLPKVPMPGAVQHSLRLYIYHLLCYKMLDTLYEHFIFFL